MSTFRALGAAVALSAMSSLNFNDGFSGGLSNAELEERRARERAKAARQTWDIDPSESRQVRRARERKERATPSHRQGGETT